MFLLAGTNPAETFGCASPRQGIVGLGAGRKAGRTHTDIPDSTRKSFRGKGGASGQRPTDDAASSVKRGSALRRPTSFPGAAVGAVPSGLAAPSILERRSPTG